MGDRLGQQLGNYRLVKLLGKGGFAEVYLGQHVRLASKQAAIKILHLIDVDARKFQEEAETTEKLVHPHIVRLLDFDFEQDTPFLVLDYAPGGSLRTLHPKGSIVPLDIVTGYLKEEEREDQSSSIMNIPIEWSVPDSVQSQYASENDEAEEQEWESIISKPHMREALRRLAMEARQQYYAGETEEGGFAIE